jgi:hypothetical protein
MLKIMATQMDRPIHFDLVLSYHPFKRMK